jgi:hypothetical protein
VLLIVVVAKRMRGLNTGRGSTKEMGISVSSLKTRLEEMQGVAAKTARSGGALGLIFRGV